MVKPISRLRFSRLLNQYKAGNHLDQEAFQSFLHYRRAKKAVIRTKNQHRFCVDGEIIATDNGEMELCPQAIPFVLPLGATLRKSR